MDIVKSAGASERAEKRCEKGTDFNERVRPSFYGRTRVTMTHSCPIESVSVPSGVRKLAAGFRSLEAAKAPCSHRGVLAQARFHTNYGINGQMRPIHSFLRSCKGFVSSKNRRYMLVTPRTFEWGSRLGLAENLLKTRRVSERS